MIDWEIFDCPSCKCKTPIEEIQTGAITSNRVTLDPNDYGLLYGDVEMHDGYIDRFQCEICGFVIKNGEGVITDEDDLIEFLGGDDGSDKV